MLQAIILLFNDVNMGSDPLNSFLLQRYRSLKLLELEWHILKHFLFFLLWLVDLVEVFENRGLLTFDLSV